MNQKESNESTAKKKLAALKEALAPLVQSRLRADQKRSPWRFEESEDIDLRELETEKAMNLAFGRPWDVLDEWSNTDDDRLAQSNDESVRDEIDSLLSKEFKEQFEAIAEELEIDEGELRDRIKDDDDLSYYQLDLHLHSMDYNYKRLVAGYASFASFRLAPDSSDELFDGLHALRIDLEDYLKIACSEIESQLDDDGALYDAEAKQWGLGDPDEDEERSWSQIYADDVREWHASYQQRTNRRVGGYDEKPVADVADIIKMAREQSGSMELIVHVSVGAATIEDFSLPAGTHDWGNSDRFMARIGSGYLAVDQEPGTGNGYSTPILAPIEVAASAFGVLKATPESDEEDAIDLTEPDATHSHLYRAGVIKREQYGKSLDPYDTEDAACIAECIKVVEKAPWWSAVLALEEIQSLRTPLIQEALNGRRTESARKEASSRLVREIEGLSKTRMQKEEPSREYARISSLLDMGADPAVQNSAGISAFELGCRQALPLGLLQRLTPPPSDESSTNNPLSQCLRTLRDLSVASDSLKPRAAEVCETAMWLLAQDGQLLPVGSQRLTPDSVFSSALKINNGLLLDRLLDAAEYQMDVDTCESLCNNLLNIVVQDMSVSLLPILVKHGIDLDESFDTKVDQKAKDVQRYPTLAPRFDDFMSVARSLKARAAANDALAELGLAPT